MAPFYFPCLNRVFWRLCLPWVAGGVALSLDGAESDPGSLHGAGVGDPLDAASEFVWSGAGLELGSVIRMANLSGSVNVLVDPWLETNTVLGVHPLAQKVTFHYQNTAPAEAMGDLLRQNGLVWRWSEAMRIGRVTSEASPNATNDCSFVFGDSGLRSKASTNIVEDLVYTDITLSEALAKLARETGLNVLWNEERLFGAGELTNQARRISFGVKGVTGLQALAGLVENQGLTLAWNPRSTVLRVVTPSMRIWEAAHPLPESLPVPTIPSATNEQQLILLDAIPLDQVLAFLCHQAGIGYIVSPDLSGNTNNPTVEGKFKNLDTLKILEALLENYGLAAVEHAETKSARIISRENLDKQRKWTNPSPIPSIIDPAQAPAQLAMETATLESAVKILGRQTGIDLLFDAELMRELRSGESRFSRPNVHFEFLKTSPRLALSELLLNFDLAVIWNPAARIGHVTDLNGYSDFTFSAAIPEAYWGEAVPELALDDVSLELALGLLAGQCGVSLEIGRSGGTQSAQAGKKVSLEFESIQPGRVFNALCTSRRLAATWDEEKKTVRVIY